MTSTVDETSSRRILFRLGRVVGGHPIVIIAAWVIVLLTAAMVVLGPIVFPDATEQNIFDALLPPGTSGHLLGTDQLGRDILKMAVAGTPSAIIGPCVVGVGSCLLGLVLGTLAGYRGGFVDTVVARWSDLLMALPLILVAIVVVGFLGGGYWLTVAILLVLSSPSDIRLVRGAVLEQSRRPYVESAKVLGVPSRRIMAVHIIPNILPMVTTNLLLTIAFSLGSLSALSFLGIGIPPGTADWGRQLVDGRVIMADNPAAVLTPALLIIVVACSINLIGDSLTQRSARRGRARR